MPQLNQPGHGEDAQSQRQYSQTCLRGDQKLLPIEMIGGKAGQGQQEEMRPELERHDNADGGRVMIRELGEHEPVLGGALHPRTDIGYQCTARPHAVVETVQRTKNTFHWISRESTGELPP